jgi:peptidoglycan/xylan/chitin deacetylase (PgdA/CDA1 family)
LDASGVATIAAHTQHHSTLTALKPQALHDEIWGSKADLERLIGHPVEDFAYPYGALNPAVEREVKASGFKIAFSTLPGYYQSQSHIYELRRIKVFDRSTIQNLLGR